MYCGKCGAFAENDSEFCQYCGYSFSEIRNQGFSSEYNPEYGHTENDANITNPNELPNWRNSNINSVDKCSTGSDEETKTVQLFDGEAAPQELYGANQMGNSDSAPINDWNMFNENEVIYEKKALTTKQPSAKRKRIILFTLIAVVLVVAIASTCCLFYFNSEQYKMEQAQKYIMEGEYGAARAEIQSFSSMNSSVLRRYIEIFEKSDEFIAEWENCKEILGSEPFDYENMNELYNSFYNELSSFKKDGLCYYISEQLSDRFDYYWDSFDSISNDCKKGSLYDEFYNLQSIYKLRFIFNSSSTENTFTLSQFSDLISTSRDYSDQLQDYISNMDASRDESNIFSTLFESMISDVDQEVEYEQSSLDEDLEKWDYYDDLYASYPDSDYSEFISSDFYELTSQEDISKNAALLYSAFKCQSLYQRLCDN